MTDILPHSIGWHCLLSLRPNALCTVHDASALVQPTTTPCDPELRPRSLSLAAVSIRLIPRYVLQPPLRSMLQ